MLTESGSVVANGGAPTDRATYRRRRSCRATSKNARGNISDPGSSGPGGLCPVQCTGTVFYNLRYGIFICFLEGIRKFDVRIIDR